MVGWPETRLRRLACESRTYDPTPMACVDVEEVGSAFTDCTALLSVMTANNEIEVLQPITKLCDVAHQRGVRFHTDATQALGKVPLSADRSAVNLVSLSAHKLYGPKGIGALAVRRRRPKIAIDP